MLGKEPLGWVSSTMELSTSHSTARRWALPVARDRIELSTFRFSVGRSYQLSYLAVGPMGTSDPDGTRTRDLRRDRAAR